MFKASALAFFHAETPVHAGSGQSFGAIDLAIQRERHTEFPIIAASGVKGALRDWFAKHPAYGKASPEVTAVFGPDTANASAHAGAAAFTDARTLLFPVRTARGVFAWVTAPCVLARLSRDLALAHLPPLPETARALSVPDGQVLGSPSCAVADAHGVLLEEYAFGHTPNAAVDALAAWLQTHALPSTPEYDAVGAVLAAHLLVVADDDFSDFVRHTTEVQARVALNDKKTTTGDGGNLFYQENLPADSVLYAAVLADRDRSGLLEDGTARAVLGLVAGLDGRRLQLGGDETVGKGICCVRVLQPPENDS